jgi:uncharacterized protein (TIGR03435 family)
MGTRRGKFLFVFTAVMVGAQPPVFEVASVRLTRSADPRSVRFESISGDRFSVKTVPLGYIVAVAFGFGTFNETPRLQGGQEWERLRTQLFDIEAIAPKGAIPAGASARVRRETMHQMLESLLTDRFKMAMHRETKEIPVYVVTVAKDGVRLAKSKIGEAGCGADPDSGCHQISGGMGRGLHSRAATIGDVVSYIENFSDRPMIDRTGLSELFEIYTEGWVPMPSGSDVADPTRPTLFSFFDRVGLKIEVRKASVEIFTIEHIQLPQEN